MTNQKDYGQFCTAAAYSNNDQYKIILSLFAQYKCIDNLLIVLLNRNDSTVIKDNQSKTEINDLKLLAKYMIPVSDASTYD